MSQQNLVSLNLTAAEITQVNDALATIRTLLGARLVALTPAQRRELVKMGDTTYSFCAQTITALNAHAASLPGNFDLAALNADWADHAKMEASVGAVRDLSEKFEDTLLAISSDIMTACTIGVGVLKAVNKLDPSLDNLLGDLRSARRRRPAAKPATPAP